jgi:hypothetical protein
MQGHFNFIAFLDSSMSRRRRKIEDYTTAIVAASSRDDPHWWGRSVVGHHWPVVWVDGEMHDKLKVAYLQP